eukprot:scaffold52641_cov85-Phaeocystis_antarctica.AAC.1
MYLICFERAGADVAECSLKRTLSVARRCVLGSVVRLAASPLQTVAQKKAAEVTKADGKASGLSKQADKLSPASEATEAL